MSLCLSKKQIVMQIVVVCSAVYEVAIKIIMPTRAGISSGLFTASMARARASVTHS